MATQKLTDFNLFVQSDKLVCFYFLATWCGHCEMMAPVLEELSDEYQEKLVVEKLDVDQNQQTAEQFGIVSIPTLLLFQNGEVVKQIVGYRPKADLVSQLADVLQGM